MVRQSSSVRLCCPCCPLEDLKSAAKRAMRHMIDGLTCNGIDSKDDILWRQMRQAGSVVGTAGDS